MLETNVSSTGSANKPQTVDHFKAEVPASIEALSAPSLIEGRLPSLVGQKPLIANVVSRARIDDKPPQINETLELAIEDLITLESEIIPDHIDIIEINNNEALDFDKVFTPESIVVGLDEFLSDFSEILITDNEPIFELTLPLEEVEAAVDSLAETIETLMPDKFAVVQEILDDISSEVNNAYAVEETALEVREAAAETQPDRSKAMAQTEIRQELEELIVELFDKAGLDYRPELIEALVELTLSGDLSQIIPSEVEPETEVEASATMDRGTHEIINRILMAISDLKRKLVNVYQLGRSALSLSKLELLTDMGH